MGIAALVLGIISIIIGFIPLCGAIAFVPALIGLILGIIDIVNKNKAGEPKGMGIAGTVLCGLAILIIAFWIFVASASVANVANDPNFINELNGVLSNSTAYLNNTL